MAIPETDGEHRKGEGNHAQVLVAPTITEHDLKNFHHKYFPGTPLPQQFIYFDNHVEDEFEDDDDDGLGYYPDGTKRTLTDEQIRIFRHSEIQRLLREEADPDSIKQEERPSVPKKKKKNKNKKKRVQTEKNSPASEPQQPLNYGKRKREAAQFFNKKQEESRRRNTSSPEPELKREPQPKKQKKAVKESINVKPLVGDATRVDPDDYKSDGENFTYRRIARDADEIPNVSIELDY